MICTRITQCVIALLIAAVCINPTLSLAAESSQVSDPIGEVVHIMGFVTAEMEGKETRKLELKSPVFIHEIIVTGRTGNVEIRFKDDTIYSQGTESTLSLDDYVFSENPSASKLLFTMGEGTFRFVTGQIVKQNPDAFALTTPMTSIGIRGTEPFAIVEPKRERIGVLEIASGHTVIVSSEQNAISMSERNLMTEIEFGRPLSPPAPVPAAVREKVIKAAPMTSQGEFGLFGSKKELQLKVDGFKNLLDFEKKQIGGLNVRPDYQQLRKIAVQERAFKNATNERDGKTKAEAGLGGGENTDNTGSEGEGGDTGSPAGSTGP